MRKAYIYIAFLLLFGVWAIRTGVFYKQLSASLPLEVLPLADSNVAFSRSNLLDEDESQVYLLGFPLSKTVPGTINTYLPEYKAVTLETARYYSGLFNMRDSETETEEYYAYQNEKGSIYIDKNIERLRYAAKEYREPAASLPMTEQQEEISPEEALQKALEFIEGNLLFLSYEESRVRFDGERYEVVFVNLLANIQNYAHTTKVILDRQGRIVTMDYYFLTYKKLGNCRIKTMMEAFYELPVDFPGDVKILLTQCRLVYFYENSIAQPAYLFEGVYPENKSFSAFVKASVYG